MANLTGQVASGKGFRLFVEPREGELRVGLRVAEWYWCDLILTVGRVWVWRRKCRFNTPMGYWVQGIQVLARTQWGAAEPYKSYYWTLGWPLRAEKE